jgi:hypothetical protein
VRVDFDSVKLAAGGGANVGRMMGLTTARQPHDNPTQSFPPQNKHPENTLLGETNVRSDFTNHHHNNSGREIPTGYQTKPYHADSDSNRAQPAPSQPSSELRHYQNQMHQYLAQNEVDQHESRQFHRQTSDQAEKVAPNFTNPVQHQQNRAGNPQAVPPFYPQGTMLPVAPPPIPPQQYAYPPYPHPAAGYPPQPFVPQPYHGVHPYPYHTAFPNVQANGQPISIPSNYRHRYQ